MADSGSPALLNVDIMHVVMSYATRNIISNLMKTCRTMNSEGAGHLLKDGVSIGCKAGLLSFIYFLAARGNPNDCFRRLLFFDKLTLRFDYYPSPDIGVALTEFFEKIATRAINFTSLTIHDAEALLTAYPPLGAAIAKLTTLQALDLSYTAERGAALLSTLQSRLVEASIEFGDGEREDEDIDEDDRNPILLLHGSQSTLVSLTVHSAASLPDGPCYTNVTDLFLSEMDLPSIEDFIHAFPNVLSLSAFDCSGYRYDPRDWEDRRKTSMLYQAGHGTWRSLCRYSGSVLILWTFGLTCRIPSIEIDFEDHKLDVKKLSDVLQDACPSRLALQLPKASCLLDEDFRAVLRMANLRVFDLRVKFDCYGDSTLCVRDVLVSSDFRRMLDVLSLISPCHRTSSSTSFDRHLRPMSRCPWTGRGLSKYAIWLAPKDCP